MSKPKVMTQEEMREFINMGIDYTKPIHIPDEWVTWPGKDQGQPKPPIIWADAAAVTDKIIIDSAAYAPDPREIVHIKFLEEEHYEVTTRNQKVFRIKGKQKPILGMCISCA